jgi:hypothetical protein
VPRYYFAVDHGDHCHEDGSGTDLPTDAAARDYAERVIRELREGGGYDAPQLRIIVTESNRTVFVLPFAGAPSHS